MPRGLDQRGGGEIAEPKIAGPFRRYQILVQDKFGRYRVGLRGRGDWGVRWGVQSSELKMMAVEIQRPAIVERPAFAVGRHQIPTMDVANVEVAGDVDLGERTGQLGVGEGETVHAESRHGTAARFRR